MRLLLARTVIGCAALATMLALGGPGVRVTRADDAPVSVVPLESDGPTCDASKPLQPSQQVVESLAALREQAARQQAAGGDVPVALNNRGYNYGSEDPDTAAVIRELERIRVESVAR